MKLFRLGRAYLSIATAILLVGCASQSNTYQTDESSADPVDTDAFADLIQDPHTAEMNSVTDGRPFYRAIGNESLARVAYALYGSRDTETLVAENPSLSPSTALPRGEKVYFIFETLRPQAPLLTKDLLKRYGEDLAHVIRAHAGNFGKTQVGVGESLQSVSKRLYGTTRYWTELYLLNIEKIPDYDVVSAGTELEYISRIELAKAEAKPENAPVAATTEVAKPEDAAAVSPTPPPPATEEVVATAPTPPPAPPVVEAPPNPAPVVAEAPIAPPPAPVVAPVKPPIPVHQVITNEDDSWLSAKNQRRALYGFLVLAVLFGIQALTQQRRPKNPVSNISAKSSGAPRVGVPLPPNSLRRVDNETKDKNNVS